MAITQFSKFINVVKEWENGGNVKPFRSKSIIEWLTNNGYEVVDTHGLPFNGTTYEVRRALPKIPHAYQVCAHFKHVSAIYGNWVGIYLYPPTCKGAEHLNGDELELYQYHIDTCR